MTGDYLRMVEEHPGFIEYVDGATGKVVSRAKAADLPRSALFELDEHGREIPIVKVVAHTTENSRELLSYGPNGQLLRSTMQYRDG